MNADLLPKQDEDETIKTVFSLLFNKSNVQRGAYPRGVDPFNL